MINIICLILILIGIIILIIGNIYISNNKNDLKEVDTLENDFAILVPARYESKVIRGLLESIKNQSVKVNMKDVYVIVESLEDETVNICKEYKATYIVRTTKRARKGYALDEAIKQIDKVYDLYFIFDADNILSKDYIKEMLKVYEKGYDIGVGYRNCKNGNDNVVAACSSLTFTMINTFGNHFRNKHHCNIVASGTGFYIKGSFIEKWGGYPFHSLTEDYELSLYGVLHNMTTYYNEDAEFFDEQPTKFSETIKQRVRWIKGYFTSRKEYVPLIRKELNKSDINKGSRYSTCLGVKGYIFLVLGIGLYLSRYLIYFFIGLFNHNISILKALSLIIIGILLVYIILVFVTYTLIKSDKLDINRKTKIKALFFNPIYLISYVYCALIALFKKDVKWDRIEHNKN